ncbi:MAG: UPF0280 family protein [Spartobacteria bacterium]|nr:UPF0280 family protein [Spartobacteria bacterium]
MVQSYTIARFSYRGATYRVKAGDPFPVVQALVRQREQLEQYIAEHTLFAASLTPLPDDPAAPRIVRRMLQAVQYAEVGPMAAVAGAMAQCAYETARSEASITDCLIDNGGDCYLAASSVVHVGLFSGYTRKDRALALRFQPEDQPVAVCSSSSEMGHSQSSGNCALATVIAEDAALADACATWVCNLTGTSRSMKEILEQCCGIPDVRAVFIQQQGRIGIKGRHVPEIVRNADRSVQKKICRDESSASSF